MGYLVGKNLSLAGAIIGVAMVQSSASLAQSPASPAQGSQPDRISIAYVPPSGASYQELFDFLRDHHALEKIQEILSPLRLPEDLTVKTAECGMINSWYKRENSKPTVTICYELLKHILDSLPNETTPDNVTPIDAEIGQFFWTTLHEVGHAIFDILNVPIFGHPEDAADNFATYVLLQFKDGQARRLIGGAAWAWRAYLEDYRRNPVIPTRLTAFASDHGFPQERFYNLLCLAFGADPLQFADLGNYLPPTRAAHCAFEYQILLRAFRKEISPHIDQDVARQVLDTNWLPN